jgi:predicted RND superfamily exporter protein
MPVVRDLRDFDCNSGGRLERWVFNHRPMVLLLCALLSLFLGMHALRLDGNGSFERMIPRSHPYIQNFLAHVNDLRNLGNTVAIAVENTDGDIYDAEYLEVLRKLTDEIMLTKGVYRGYVKSLWLPAVRWTDVVEQGYVGGPVMPDDFDASPAKMEQLRSNVARARLIGTLVSADLKSSLVIVPLLENDPETLEPLDYGALSEVLEHRIRSLQTPHTRIHIIGFAKLIGDLIEGLGKVLSFFAISAAIATFVIWLYTRCIRSTALLISVAMLGVVWMLGLIQLLGYSLDPYSILVPFLIFAIGASHGAQKMNGIMQDIGRGTHRYIAARYTFRRLFLAGLTALITNVVGFAVLMVVDIPVIRELALATSIGVSVLIVTKLILIPVALSYIGVSPKAAQRMVERDRRESLGQGSAGLRFVQKFTQRNWAIAAIAVTAVVFVASLVISRDLQIGDLDEGAPELWPKSRYNLDADFVSRNFGLSVDQFAVIVVTEPDGAQKHEVMLEMQRLSWLLQNTEGVRGVMSVADILPYVNSAQFETNPKWTTVHRSPITRAGVNAIWSLSQDFINADMSVMPVIAFLSDHKAQTLSRLLKVVEDFAREHDSDTLKFLPVAGSAGIAAVTNIVVEKAHYQMLALLYTAVALLCFITFRSWRATLVALIPLMITSVICEALMVKLGMGIKVATLPVHALGVGVGVDYALYLLSIQLGLQRAGASLSEAYAGATRFTGKIVALIGFTMAVGVVTWAFSPIKFQADMGILLTFMLIWNMLGALVLIPALSHFLLPSAISRTSGVLPKEASGHVAPSPSSTLSRSEPQILAVK